MSLKDDIEFLKSRIFELESGVRGVPYFRWATVAGTAPLRVRVDGDAAVLPDAPATLVSGLRAGERVRVEFQNRRATVTGRGGGDTVNEPVRVERNDVDNITANTMAEFNITTITPAAVTVSAPQWWRFTLQGWRGGTTSPLRVGVELRGATSSPPQSPQWGSMIRAEANGSVFTEKIVRLNPGVTTVHVMGHRESTGGTPTFGYQVLMCMPVQ